MATISHDPDDQNSVKNRSNEIPEEKFDRTRYRLMRCTRQMMETIDEKLTVDFFKSLFYYVTLHLRYEREPNLDNDISGLLSDLSPSLNRCLVLVMIDPEDFYLIEMRMIRSGLEFLKQYFLQDDKWRELESGQGFQYLENFLKHFSRVDDADFTPTMVPDLKLINHHSWWTKKERENSNVDYNELESDVAQREAEEAQAIDKKDTVNHSSSDEVKLTPNRCILKFEKYLPRKFLKNGYTVMSGNFLTSDVKVVQITAFDDNISILGKLKHGEYYVVENASWNRHICQPEFYYIKMNVTSDTTISLYENGTKRESETKPRELSPSLSQMKLQDLEIAEFADVSSSDDVKKTPAKCIFKFDKLLPKKKLSNGTVVMSGNFTTSDGKIVQMSAFNDNIQVIKTANLQFGQYYIVENARLNTILPPSKFYDIKLNVVDNTTISPYKKGDFKATDPMAKKTEGTKLENEARYGELSPSYSQTTAQVLNTSKISDHSSSDDVKNTPLQCVLKFDKHLPEKRLINGWVMSGNFITSDGKTVQMTAFNDNIQLIKSANLQRGQYYIVKTAKLNTTLSPSKFYDIKLNVEENTTISPYKKGEIKATDLMAKKAEDEETKRETETNYDELSSSHSETKSQVLKTSKIADHSSSDEVKNTPQKCILKFDKHQPERRSSSGSPFMSGDFVTSDGKKVQMTAFNDNIQLIKTANLQCGQYYVVENAILNTTLPPSQFYDIKLNVEENTTFSSYKEAEIRATDPVEKKKVDEVQSLCSRLEAIRTEDPETFAAIDLLIDRI